MSTNVPDAKIYYTTDGTDPKVMVSSNGNVQENNAQLYSSNGITIDKTTVFKAVAVEPGKDKSDVTSVKFEKLEASKSPSISGEEKFDVSTTVTITAPAENTTIIYYTLDGTEPIVEYVNGSWQNSDNTLIYKGEFTLQNGATVKAIAITDDLGPSGVVEKTFVKMPRAATPNLGTSGDGEQLFSDEIIVKVEGLQEGAKVLYTLDGNTPTYTESNDGPVAGGTTQIAQSGEIRITESCVLMVVVWESGKLPSNPVSATYTNTTAAATPVISGEHHFIGQAEVTISASDNAKIYYTTDGTDPTTGSNLYSEPLILTETATVKALAIEDGKLPSAIATRDFTKWEKTTAPTISGDQSFTDQTRVTIEAASGASIYYTLDDTEPSFTISENGTVTPNPGTHLYADPIPLTSGCTVKAAAHQNGNAPSDVVSVVFTKLERSGEPVITAPEVFYEEATISLSAAAGAEIYYTADGSNPDGAANGTRYEQPFTLTSAATIKAVALEAGKAVSPVVVKQVAQANRTPKPVLNLPEIFEGETEIEITAPDARIFYALGSEAMPEVKISEADGTITLGDGTLEYTGPIPVQATTVINAVAVKAGCRVSEVAQGVTTKKGQTSAPVIKGDNPFAGETLATITAPDAARILYTLDGSDPSWVIDANEDLAAPKDGSATQIYYRNTTVIKIKDRTTVKAVAHERGKTVSEIVSETFVPVDATPAPQISGRNPFAMATEVTLTAENDAKIFYTTDGTDPELTGYWYSPTLKGDTKQYAGPFTLQEAAVVKAVAWEKRLSLSAVAEEKFSKFDLCEAPMISGTTPFESETEISITAPNGSQIYYSIDGSDPTASLDDNGVITGGPKHYEGPFKITSGAVVRAVAVSPQKLPSEIVSKEFVQLVKTPQPVIAAPDLFGDEATVEIRVPEGAQVRYTLDGSEPTETSQVYEGALTITSPCEVRARAWKSGCQVSDVTVLSMRQMELSEPVVISGTSPFVHEMMVTLSAAPQAKIYYTTDGVAPVVKVKGADKVEVSENALLYEAPIRIEADAVIIAVALEGSKRASEPVERRFQRAVISEKSVIEGVTPFLESTEVTISAGQGAEIYFTLDGSAPTQSSIRYTGPFRLNYSAVVKAIAQQPEHDFSEVAEMSFVKEELSETPQIEAPELFGDEAHVRITGTGTVWYTLDGTNPVPGNSERYEEELVLTEPFTIKAVALSEGKLPSEVAEHTGRQMERTGGVTISGDALFDGRAEISLEAGDATIWYTLDGTVPSVRVVDAGEPQVGEGAILYAGPFEITSSLTVTAVAIEPGKRASLASQRAFERMDESNAPSISGTTPFDSQTLVTITAQSGAKIYYTTDGTRPQPGASSTSLYSEPILVTATTLVRAVAVEENKALSPVAEMLFERMEVSGKPEIEVAEIFGDEADVSIKATSGARIFYTIDGSMPDASAAEYSGPFVISSSAVIRAVALEEGKTLSIMAEREAQQMGRTAAPEIGVKEMSDGHFLVTVKAPSEAPVYYSVGEPAQLTLRNREELIAGNSTLVYGQPVKTNAGAEIYAVAIRPGFRPSAAAYAVMPEREQVEAPVIEGDTPYEKATLVSMTAEEGLKIFYTLDGTDPEVERDANDEPIAVWTSTMEYYVPFEISKSMTIKAVAAGAGTALSALTEKAFVRTDDPSGIDDLSADGESVEVGPGKISGPADMKVYDTWGRQCPNEGLRPGVYIVVTGGRSFKVMVKN